MLRIDPTAEFSLGHRAYHMRIAANGQVVAGSREGCVSVLTAGLERIARLDVGREIESLSLSSDGGMVATVCAESIRILDARSGREIVALAGSYQDAWFDDFGATLWAVRQVSDEEVVVETRDARNFAVRHQIAIDDPYGESAWSFHRHPAVDRVTVWAGAGQDGQSLFWLQRHAHGIDVDEFELDDTMPPGFCPDGREFLMAWDETELQRYSFPECELLGQLSLPDDGDSRFGFDCHYLCPGAALVVVGEGLLALLDVGEMRIDRPVVIRGHEPRPTSELYPGLDDDELASDTSLICRQSDGYFVSSHLVLPGDISNQKHILLRWRNPFATADYSREATGAR